MSQKFKTFVTVLLNLPFIINVKQGTAGINCYHKIIIPLILGGMHLVKTVLLITNTHWKTILLKKLSELKGEGLYVIIGVSDLEEALLLSSEMNVDLMIIDTTIIKSSSSELCRRILIGLGIPVMFFNQYQLINSRWEWNLKIT